LVWLYWVGIYMEKDKMKIRKATMKDLKEITGILMKESSKKPYNEKYNFKTALKEVRDMFKQDIYIAENEDETIGFISSNITPDNKKKAYIRELWLKSEYQRKGIGKSLVKFIEKMYKNKGVKIIRIVVKRNAGAFNFYKKIKYNENKSFVYMEKKLK
jgi:ribosomal protein S18 acetylase RimI-like enzyme